MRTWEQTVSYGLRALGLESIRNKLLAFAVLATLIPSISTAWVSYAHNQLSLTEKITGEQQSVSSQASRELDLWLKERSEEHTSELQSHSDLVCRLLLEKKNRHEHPD